MADPAPKPSGKNWSRVANAYADAVDEDDALNPVGAGCNEVLAAVDSTLPFDRASYVMDMGTGPGGLISRILTDAEIPDGARIVAADVSEALLEKLEERKGERRKESKVWERLEVRNWDARDLTAEVKDGEISHLLSTFAYFAFAAERQALAEALRVLKPGGLFVETSMGFTEWGHLVQFFKEVRPDMIIPAPAKHWESVEGTTKLLTDVGFVDVKVKEFRMGLRFETHEDAVEFPFAAFPWVKGLLADWSEEEVARARKRMLEFVRERHPEAPLRLDGTGLIGWGSK